MISWITWSFVSLSSLGLLYWHISRESRNPFYSFQEWMSNSPSTPKQSNIATSLSPGPDYDRIFWFIQISDIHINKFNKSHGAEHLEYFLQHCIPAIKPLFVVATGDLTDAKSKGLSSGQHKQEWQIYENLLRKYGAYERPHFWFDVRGNHDCFDVPSWNSPQNLFRQHAKMKTSMYSHVFELPFGNYGLAAIDGCPDYGPSRPFNFFGSLDTRKMDVLESQLKSFEEKETRHNFIISHYPVATMQFQKSSSGSTFSELSGRFSAYFSGHLHKSLFGMVNEIYSRQPTGFLDLELADLKDHRTMRLASVDHDIFTFVDLPIDKLPAILITNPKDAKLYIPYHEDIKTSARSTHLRVLVFSKAQISSVTASIEGKTYHLIQSQPNSPLFVGPWNPSELSPGLHSLNVTAIDNEGNTGFSGITFSVDGTPALFSKFGNFISLMKTQIWIKRIYWSSLGILWMLILVPFVYVKYLKRCGRWSERRLLWISNLRSIKVNMHHCSFWSNPMLYFKWFLDITAFRLCEATCDPWVFYPFVLYTLYHPIGPLKISRFGSSDNTYSGFFVWGIYHPGTGWIHLLDTWVYSTASLIVQTIPSYIFCIVVCTAGDLYHKYHNSPGKKTLIPLEVRPFHEKIWFRLFFLTWFVVCLFVNSILVFTYGVSALLGGFGFGWNLAWVTVLILRGAWISRELKRIKGITLDFKDQ